MKIAIDGPAGAGKSTVARAVAKALGMLYVDTGAMYRAVALACLETGTPVHDEQAVAAVADQVRLDFDDHPSGQRLLLNGADVTDRLRDPAVTRLSSPISAIAGVRRALVAHQQAMARDRAVVMEGRDIGTVVLPDADLKVFLTASLAERARRRYLELIGRGTPADPEAVEADIRERDERDSTRSLSPLQPAPDAVILNTDKLSAEQVVARIMELSGAAQ